MSAPGTGSGDDLLDQPAIVGVRRITVRLVDRAEHRWRRLTAAAPADRTPDGPASDTLHDFRVALRSLASWVQTHNDILGLSGKNRRRLRAAVAATSSMRDTEVLAAQLRSIELPSDAGSTAARSWATQLLCEAQAVDRLDEIANDVNRSLAAIRAAAATVRWEQPVSAPWLFPSLAADLAPRVRTQEAKIRHRLELITGPDQVREQHRARLAAKKLRYLFEPIESDLPEARAALRELKQLQNRLGDLHDLHTALDAVSAAADAAEHVTTKRGHRDDRSLRSGFDEVAAVFQSAADEAYARFEQQCRTDRAAHLFVAVEAAATSLCARASAEK